MKVSMESTFSLVSMPSGQSIMNSLHHSLMSVSEKNVLEVRNWEDVHESCHVTIKYQILGHWDQKNLQKSLFYCFTILLVLMRILLFYWTQICDDIIQEQPLNIFISETWLSSPLSASQQSCFPLERGLDTGHIVGKLVVLPLAGRLWLGGVDGEVREPGGGGLFIIFIVIITVFISLSIIVWQLINNITKIHFHCCWSK